MDIALAQTSARNLKLLNFPSKLKFSPSNQMFRTSSNFSSDFSLFGCYGRQGRGGKVNCGGKQTHAYFDLYINNGFVETSAYII